MGDKIARLRQHPSIYTGLNPRVEGAINLYDSIRKDRRIAEFESSQALDDLIKLKRLREELGVEVNVKPKTLSLEALEGYRIASEQKGGIKDPSVSSRVAQTNVPARPEGLGYPSQVQYPRDVRLLSDLDNSDLDYLDLIDYDIASKFGFAGNY